MIDRDRVRKLARGESKSESGIPISPHGAAKVTWQEHHAVLMAIARASSEEELDRLEPGLPKAYRGLHRFGYARKWTMRPDVMANPRVQKRDEEFCVKTIDLIKAVEENPLFNDRERRPRAWVVGQRILKLETLLVYAAPGTGAIYKMTPEQGLVISHKPE
jgi:hypothetical protein